MRGIAPAQINHSQASRLSQLSRLSHTKMGWDKWDKWDGWDSWDSRDRWDKSLMAPSIYINIFINKCKLMAGLISLMSSKTRCFAYQLRLKIK